MSILDTICKALNLHEGMGYVSHGFIKPTPDVAKYYRAEPWQTDHNKLAKDIGFNNTHDAVGKGMIRYYHTTYGEHGVSFNKATPDTVKHSINHIKNNVPADAGVVVDHGKKSNDFSSKHKAIEYLSKLNEMWTPTVATSYQSAVKKPAIAAHKSYDYGIIHPDTRKRISSDGEYADHERLSRAHGFRGGTSHMLDKGGVRWAHNFSTKESSVEAYGSKKNLNSMHKELSNAPEHHKVNMDIHNRETGGTASTQHDSPKAAQRHLKSLASKLDEGHNWGFIKPNGELLVAQKNFYSDTHNELAAQSGLKDTSTAVKKGYTRYSSQGTDTEGSTGIQVNSTPTHIKNAISHLKNFVPAHHKVYVDVDINTPHGKYHNFNSSKEAIQHLNTLKSSMVSEGTEQLITEDEKWGFIRPNGTTINGHESKARSHGELACDSGFNGTEDALKKGHVRFAHSDNPKGSSLFHLHAGKSALNNTKNYIRARIHPDQAIAMDVAHTKGGFESTYHDGTKDAVRYLNTKLNEDAPANNVGGGNIAGAGVGSQGEPPMIKKVLKNIVRRKKPNADNPEVTT